MVKIYICPYCGNMEYYEFCEVSYFCKPQVMVSMTLDGKTIEYVEWVRKGGDLESCGDVICSKCYRNVIGLDVSDGFAVKLVKAKDEKRIDMMLKYIADNIPIEELKYSKYGEFVEEALSPYNVDVEAFIKLVKEVGSVKEAKVLLKLVKT